MSYAKTVALGLDDFCAAILLARNDLCISAACGLVLAGRDAPLKLNALQRVLLKGIGKGLNALFPGHCAGAIQGDIARAFSSLRALGTVVPYKPVAEMPCMVCGLPGRHPKCVNRSYNDTYGR